MEAVKQSDSCKSSYMEEQKVLLKTFKQKYSKKEIKDFFKNFPSNIWKFIHNPIKNINLISLIAIIIVIACISVMATVWKYSSNTNLDIFGDKFNTINRISDLKLSYDRFVQASPEEKLMKWIWMFKDWNYALSGDPKVKQADCVGSVYMYFRGWGSNMTFEGIATFKRRVQNLSEQGELKIRKNIQEIVSGDIIMLDLGGNNQHIAMVYDTCNGLVRYCDMNVYTKKWGLEKITWGDSNAIIAEHSFAIWLGDLMQDLNKKM